jgi:hypothetical protein
MPVASPEDEGVETPHLFVQEADRVVLGIVGRPTALCSASSERKELEQTSSAKPPVW